MRPLQPITEHEMVAHFLKTEVHSVRFREELLGLLARDGLEPRIFEAPDTRNPEENALRLRLLGEYRGYRQHEGIFMYVPDDTAWYRTALVREDLARILYIDYDYWTELSCGSRRAIDAAPRIRAGVEIFGKSTQWALGMARAVEQGAVFPELILVAADAASDLTVLEGHARVTAYCLALDHVPDPLPVILGLGPGMERV
jgi:hypothetical protein